VNRLLPTLNLLGVLLLAALCVFQWQANRRLNLQAIALEKNRFALAQQLDERDAAIKGQIADLDDFRGRLEKSAADLRQTQDHLSAATVERDQLTARCAELQAAGEALKASLDKWTAAVAARDEALKQDEAQLQTLAAERNDAIQKFNGLATRFNAEVEELKQANQTIEKLTAERNDLVLKFNDLAARFNALAATPPATATRP